MSNTLGFLKVGQPLNAEIKNMVQLDGVSITDLSGLKFWGSVKDALADADADAITTFNSVDDSQRFEFSADNSVLTVQMLTSDRSENMIESDLTIEETGLTICGMPIIGYIFADIWVSKDGVGPGQIYYEKLPVVRPATISKQ